MDKWYLIWFHAVVQASLPVQLHLEAGDEEPRFGLFGLPVPFWSDHFYQGQNCVTSKRTTFLLIPFRAIFTVTCLIEISR